MKTLVYGSLNIDLVFSVDHIVIPGETISSSSLFRGVGGKGANQAAALARAGMETWMAGSGYFLTARERGYSVQDSLRGLQGGSHHSIPERGHGVHSF